MHALSKKPACPDCAGKSYRLEPKGGFATAVICDCAKDCPRCGGSGHVLIRRQETFSQKVGPKEYEVFAPCSCRILSQRTALFDAAAVPSVHASASFESYRPSNASQDQALKVAHAYALGFKKAPAGKGFILCGPVGTGKSHLLAATLAHLTMECGVETRYAEISLIYATIRRGFQDGKSGGEIIGPLSEVEVLAIDELGKGRCSQFELETLDELIARRYNAGKPTLFATNYSLAPQRPGKAGPPKYESTDEATKASREQELLRFRVGERIYSRLCEMCQFVEMPGETPDHRRTKHELDPRHGRSRRS